MSLTFLPLLFFLLTSACNAKPWCIMIDPAGDAQYAGRSVNGNFERGATLQFAQELKKVIEHQHAHVSVILTRFPGETVAPLQNANFANRMQADFYLSISMYQEEKTKPELFIYSFSNGNDFVSRPAHALSFCPIDSAHRAMAHVTKQYADFFYTSLTSKTNLHLFDTKGPFRIPFKPLLGIQAPALALEIGIKASTDWKQYVEPIALALQAILQGDSHA